MKGEAELLAAPFDQKKRQILTFRVLVLKVTDQADVFLHSVKGSQLQRISYHLHRLLQKLEAEKK